MARRLRTLLIRSALAALVAYVLINLPLPPIPSRTWFAFVQVPIVIFCLICYIGKLLIDTFYYNHYKP